jgi:hypothetical protein
MTESIVPIHVAAKREEPAERDRFTLKDESDKYEITVVEAVKPTWRDVWAIVRGRYEPKVRKRRQITVLGMEKALKEVWTADNFAEQLYAYEGSE